MIDAFFLEAVIRTTQQPAIVAALYACVHSNPSHFCDFFAQSLSGMASRHCRLSHRMKYTMRRDLSTPVKTHFGNHISEAGCGSSAFYSYSGPQGSKTSTSNRDWRPIRPKLP
jgi:hypothetical protein